MKLNTSIEKIWFALGKFTFRFAEVEDLLRENVLEYAGGSTETAKILLDSARVDALSQKLRKIAEMRGEDLPPQLVNALAQLNTLGGVRNLIFHHGPNNVQDAIVTTTYNAKPLLKGEELTTTVDDLHAMASDLLAIRLIIMRMFDPGIEAQAPSWSYKRPQSKRLRPRPDDSGQTFRHPRTPFPE